MPVSVTLNFMAAVALGLQLLIFVYLYRSHRVRFFRYVVWAWACFLVHKALSGAQYLLPHPSVLGGAAGFSGVMGVFLILASGLAFRWNYSIRPLHVVPVVGFALYVALQGPAPDSGLGIIDWGGYVSGTTLLLGGLAFWPTRTEPVPPAGTQFLAASLALWGVHRVITPRVDPSPDGLGFLAANLSFLLIYFLVIFAVVIVVLDRARSEAATLKEFNERLIDGLGEGLQLVDDTFTVRHANRWLTEQLRVTPGRRCYEALTADRRQCPGCPMGERATLSTPVRLHVTGAPERRFELTCSPVRQPDGRILLLDLVADVTERERMRNRLTEAERLASVGELAASVAHEIRNPLAAIVNATALLERDEALAAEERTATIGALRKEAHRLNGILSDFLRFARPGEPKCVEGDIRDVVSHVIGLVTEQQADAGQLAVEMRVDPDVPRFTFDPDQLTQVLWNVSLNAIEGMKGRGRVLIHGRLEREEAVIEVADTGPGIPPEDLRRIFEPFYSKRPSGTGLGLPIARRIVAAHGGRIDVDSVVGEGTRVRIRLPVT